jgi:excisionase family DNA binding protein
MDDASGYLTIYEFAKLIGVHHNTIRRAIKNGHISAFRIGNGKRSQYRISKIETNRLAFENLEKIIGSMIDSKLLP